MPEPNLRISLISRQRIRDQSVGLNEPSGLTLSHDSTGLYTVSDDTRAIFRLDLQGQVVVTESFFITVDDLEGIAISRDGQYLHAVQEKTNSVISFDIARRLEIGRRALTSLHNYSSIARHFPDPPDNKGVEGITVDTRTGNIIVVKEGRPGLLIAIDLPAARILESRLLTETNGFSHPQIPFKKLDFSGLSYDSSRNTLWITSDKGQCVFHYDWQQDRVLQRLDLISDTKKGSSRVRKSEGVAIDPEHQRLYVVSERDGDLYTYRIHTDD